MKSHLNRRSIWFVPVIVGLFSSFAVFQPARAAVITLDFETPATGSNLLMTPLVTSTGTITLSNATAIGLMNAGSGNGVLHDQIVNPGFALFSFDFDVSSVSFTYSGNGSGVFTGEVLDVGATVVDSFFDPDTNGGGDPFGPIMLSGPAIRSFRFADAPGTSTDLSSIDNLIITPIPIPPAVWFFASGLIGFVGMARRKAA